MTAAIGRDRPSRSDRIIKYFRRILRHPPRPRTEQPDPVVPPALDLGDPTVRQAVHDLRNQLKIMSASVDVISNLGLLATAEDLIGDLHEASERASGLARQLLEVPRPGSGAHAAVDLNKMVTTVVATILRLTGNRVDLQLCLSAEPALVIAHPRQIERIIFNLGLNACEAMAGGGLLTVETQLVGRSNRTDTIPRRHSHARLTIRDTGPGMKPEMRARLFDPSLSTMRVAKAASGFGLWSVALTVQQLQGEISVETAAGRGTSIVIAFPLTAYVIDPRD